ncbi:uracil-DNA glycosylase, partial [Paraburkholderia sp. SIMBA_061]
ALRAPDPETRHRAYAAIVAALQDARKLSQRHR